MIASGCARKFTFDPITQDLSAVAPAASVSAPECIPARAIFFFPDAVQTTMRDSQDKLRVQRRDVRAQVQEDHRRLFITIYTPIAVSKENKAGAHKVATQLELIEGPNGEIQLISFVDARRETRTNFSPALTLLPGCLQGEFTDSTKVSVHRDTPESPRIDGGKATSQARTLGADRIETLLTIELSSSYIQQRREYRFSRGEDAKLILTGEIEGLRVNVGPLNIIDDANNWTVRPRD